MQFRILTGAASALAVALAAATVSPASADAVADFYRGKTVKIVVAAGPAPGAPRTHGAKPFATPPRC